VPHIALTSTLQRVDPRKQEAKPVGFARGSEGDIMGLNNVEGQWTISQSNGA